MRTEYYQGKRVIVTNYKAALGAKSLRDIAIKNGAKCVCKTKAKTTNSYYVTLEHNNINITIRISDHSISLEHFEDHEFEWVCNTGNNIELNIITKEEFIKAKEKLTKLLVL